MVWRSLQATNQIQELKMQAPSSSSVIGSATKVRLYRPAKRHRDFYPDPKYLARSATQALIEEAELTPKPGLVDRRSSGSHHDLSLELLINSACVLEPYFQRMAEEAQREQVPTRLRKVLGEVGREAESAMLNATSGANTHRGAIWSLGLLTAAAAVQVAPSASLICVAAGKIARLPDSFRYIRQPRKLEPWRTDPAFGARTEAFAGFPHIRSIALPALRHTRAMGVIEGFARIDTLLTIMSTLPDTCILRRGGASALSAVQQGARRVGREGGSSTFEGSIALRMLEQTMLQLWVSPGGSADLLAATLFLDRLTSVRAPLR
jgi:triphosphoribosyl-dephospho-CoA synthase